MGRIYQTNDGSARYTKSLYIAADTWDEMVIHIEQSWLRGDFGDGTPAGRKRRPTPNQWICDLIQKELDSQHGGDAARSVYNANLQKTKAERIHLEACARAAAYYRQMKETGKMHGLSIEEVEYSIAAFDEGRRPTVEELAVFKKPAVNPAHEPYPSVVTPEVLEQRAREQEAYNEQLRTATEPVEDIADIDWAAEGNGEDHLTD